MNRPVVEAVIANHNTSLFAELALRSLVATHASVPGACDLRITVRDNHSTDGRVENLKLVTKELGASFELSAWPASTATANTHGDVLRDFVLDHVDTDYFLFVDADIDFDEPSTLQLMLEDIEAHARLWAVQARFRWLERNRGEGSSLAIWAGRPIEVRVARTAVSWDEAQPIAGRIRRRVHPGCALVKNMKPVRSAAELLGFGVALIQSPNPEVAGFFDTAGLASAALEVAGLRYALSRATVHHFFNVSYESRDLNRKVEDCEARLARFTGGP